MIECLFFKNLMKLFIPLEDSYMYAPSNLQFASKEEFEVLKKAEPQHHPIFGESQFRAKNIFQKQDL